MTFPPQQPVPKPFPQPVLKAVFYLSGFLYLNNARVYFLYENAYKR